MADVGNGRSEAPEPPTTEPQRIRFDYIKSNFFRVVHADGVFGGVTPNLDIHLDVWSQRSAIPKQTVYEVKPDGTLGDEIEEERTGRDAIVREVEVGIVINLDLAKQIVAWLQEQIAATEHLRREIRTEPREITAKEE